MNTIEYETFKVFCGNVNRVATEWKMQISELSVNLHCFDSFMLKVIALQISVVTSFSSP